jgi:hypothetical protein
MPLAASSLAPFRAAFSRDPGVMMSTKQKEQPPEAKSQQALQQEVAVGNSVMTCLGRPADLHRVQVSPLWAGFFRVNVFVGPEFTACKVAHSYFLEADGDGKILSSCPAITRTY